METAFLPASKRLPQPGDAEKLELLQPAQMLYARSGYTVANEGFTGLASSARSSCRSVARSA